MMQSREIVKTDLEVFSEKLDNGLKVYIVPKSDSNNVYVTFTTNYGAYQSEFIPYDNDEMIKVPEGVAHFLEHKLFATEDGTDPFTFFGKSGASSNASTSTYKTTYLFEGMNDFERNLNYLLDFVQEPYFTDENVEEEKGIIIQELKMYQDNSFRMGYEKSLKNTFKTSPIRVPVGGSVSSVSAITKEDLYTCYNTFYHPSNMILVITGSVNPEKTLEIVKNNQEHKKFNAEKEIITKKYDEPDQVFKKKEILKMNVTMPKVFINIKVNATNDYDLDISDLMDYYGIYIESTFGATSIFYERMLDEHIVTDPIDFDFINAKTHIDIMLIAEVSDPNKFIKEALDELNKRVITKEDFERKKKTMVASLIFMSDNIYRINSMIVNNNIFLGEVDYDSYDKIMSLSYDIENDIINSADFKNYATVIIEPKNID